MADNLPLEKTPVQAKTPGITSWLDSTATKVTGVGVAIGATIFTMRDAISRAYFKTINRTKNGAFADIQNWRETEIAKIHAPARAPNPKPVLDAAEKIGAISREYDRRLTTRKKLLGFDNMLTNVFKEAKVLRRHQWIEVAFATTAVASVAVGAIFAIASSRETALNQEKINREKQGPSL